MGRDVSVETMMFLPRMTGAEAAALGEQFLAAAKENAGVGLPLFIERPRARLAVAVGDLIGAIAPKEQGDPKAAKVADRQVDGGWRAFSRWLGSLIGLPDDTYPDLDKARTLNTLCFSQGLSFIVLSYREEWAESEARLKAIADGGYESVIAALGGAPLLATLKNAHARYGDALGIKTPAAQRVAPEVREKLSALAAAMKSYVVKTVAWADPEEPGSEALSAALVAPLVSWKETPTRLKDAADDSDPDVGDAVEASDS